MLAKIEKTAIRFDRPLLGADGEALDFEAPRVWPALYARAQWEQKAADWLRLARLFAYWPNYLHQVPCGNGRRVGRLARRARFTSVIPGIVLIAARADTVIDPWPIVRQAPGIIGYLRTGNGDAATLTEEDIQIIRSIEGGLNLPPPLKASHRFKSGDKVRFIDDLVGRWPPGKVTAIANDGRISIEVPLLGRVVPIWAYAHQIEAM